MDALQTTDFGNVINIPVWMLGVGVLVGIFIGLMIFGKIMDKAFRR